jgi:hypothetical protein
MSDQPPKFTASSTNETVDAIKAHGDVKTKVAVIWLVGIITAILAIGGLFSFYYDPDKSKDLWVIIGPIIAAGITGGVAYLVGGKPNSG